MTDYDYEMEQRCDVCLDYLAFCPEYQRRKRERQEQERLKSLASTAKQSDASRRE